MCFSIHHKLRQVSPLGSNGLNGVDKGILPYMRSRDTYLISAARESEALYDTLDSLTYVRNYAVVESWGADGYIHIVSRAKVENGMTVFDEIWSCIYEPE